MKAFLVDLENTAGELARAAEAVAAKGVNITGISGATCGDRGRIALLVSDEGTARVALREAACRFEEIETVEATMLHEPGTLARAARRLADAGVNIESVIPVGMTGNDMVVAFVTSDPIRARDALSSMATSMR